jgi:hypothetical protein
MCIYCTIVTCVSEQAVYIYTVAIIVYFLQPVSDIAFIFVLVAL